MDLNKRSGSHVRRVSDPGCSAFSSVFCLAAEALQACSLSRGTKATLELRLEPAETHPGAPVFEKRRSGTNKPERFANKILMNRG